MIFENVANCIGTAMTLNLFLPVAVRLVSMKSEISHQCETKCGGTTSRVVRTGSLGSVGLPSRIFAVLH